MFVKFFFLPPFPFFTFWMKVTVCIPWLSVGKTCTSFLKEKYLHSCCNCSVRETCLLPSINFFIQSPMYIICLGTWIFTTFGLQFNSTDFICLKLSQLWLLEPLSDDLCVLLTYIILLFKHRIIFWNYKVL